MLTNLINLSYAFNGMLTTNQLATFNLSEVTAKIQKSPLNL